MDARILTSLATVVACGTSALPTPPAPTAVLFSAPGPLIASHATLACDACHVDDSPRLANDKCLACHAAIAPRGLHANPDVADTPCGTCHRDHRGAAFASSGWAGLGGRASFDHALAGWPLDKGHRVACERCHTQSTRGRPRFVGVLDRTCSGCHPSPHAGTPFVKIADCETCHGGDTFADVSAFDHDEDAPSIGASHRRVACIACHAPQLGDKAPSTACETCHPARSPHGSRFAAFGTPARCATCHAPSVTWDRAAPPVRSPWRPNAFAHAKDARWELGYLHGDVTCRQCHRGTTPADFERLAPGKACKGCHAHAKVHADAQFTNQQCLQCHVAPGGS